MPNVSKPISGNLLGLYLRHDPQQFARISKLGWRQRAVSSGLPCGLKP